MPNRLFLLLSSSLSSAVSNSFLDAKELMVPRSSKDSMGMRLCSLFMLTVMEEALAEQLKNQELSTPENKSQKGGCYYTAIPRVVKQKGLCGEDLTRLNLDKTQLLESILMKEYGGDEDALLAELQFAFIAFLVIKKWANLL